MERDQDRIKMQMMDAIDCGCLETVSDLINSYGLSYSQGWAQGYVLLRDALEKGHVAIAKLLLTSGCKVNKSCKKKDLSVTPLHYAVIYGDTDIVEMLINYGAYIDAKNGSGETPLCCAIIAKKIEHVELLLKHGANPKAINEGRSLLHIAASSNQIEIVEILLKYGAYIDCVCTSTKYVSYSHKGFTPLHFAVENGNTEVIEFLLSKGASVAIKGEDGTPLHIAAINKRFNQTDKDVETVKLLLTKGCDINATTKDNRTPLHIATETGYVPIVNLLLKHGAKVDNQDKDGRTILYLAVEQQNLTIIEHILKYCPDINNQSNRNCFKIAVISKNRQCKNIVTALLEYGFTVNSEDANDPDLLNAAIEKGYLKIVEDLLKYGANINAQNKTGKALIFRAIENAKKKENIEIIKILLQHDLDINVIDNTGSSALHYTAFLGYGATNDEVSIKSEIAKLLLYKGANIDAQTEKGETPLHLAVLSGYAKVVQAFLEYNTNVNTKSNNGFTALHFSALRGNQEICIMLLNKGSDVNAEAKDGLTPLHIASKTGNKDVVKILLKYGAKVDAQNENDITPLHLAAQKDHRDIVKTLLKFGAYIDCTDKNGRTALHIAANSKNVKIVIILLQYGADVNSICRNNFSPLHYASKRRLFHDDINDDILDQSTTHPYKTFETIMCHMIKMITANLYVCEQNLNLYSFINSKMSNIRHKNIDFQKKCEKEIACMKSTKINNSNVSFYDILVKDTNSLPMYLRNENIVQVLLSNDYKKSYPMYAGIINIHLQKGMERSEILEESYKIFYFIFKNFPELPCECTEKIFSYLSNEELRILIQVFKPLNISNANISNSNTNNAEITSNVSQV